MSVELLVLGTIQEGSEAWLMVQELMSRQVLCPATPKEIGKAQLGNVGGEELLGEVERRARRNIHTEADPESIGICWHGKRCISGKYWDRISDRLTPADLAPESEVTDES